MNQYRIVVALCAAFLSACMGASGAETKTGASTSRGNQSLNDARDDLNRVEQELVAAVEEELFSENKFTNGLLEFLEEEEEDENSQSWDSILNEMMSKKSGDPSDPKALGVLGTQFAEIGFCGQLKGNDYTIPVRAVPPEHRLSVDVGGVSKIITEISQALLVARFSPEQIYNPDVLKPTTVNQWFDRPSTVAEKFVAKVSIHFAEQIQVQDSNGNPETLNEYPYLRVIFTTDSGSYNSAKDVNPTTAFMVYGVGLLPEYRPTDKGKDAVRNHFNWTFNRGDRQTRDVPTTPYGVHFAWPRQDVCLGESKGKCRRKTQWLINGVLDHLTTHTLSGFMTLLVASPKSYVFYGEDDYPGFGYNPNASKDKKEWMDGVYPPQKTRSIAASATALLLKEGAKLLSGALVDLNKKLEAKIKENTPCERNRIELAQGYRLNTKFTELFKALNEGAEAAEKELNANFGDNANEYLQQGLQYMSERNPGVAKVVNGLLTDKSQEQLVNASQKSVNFILRLILNRLMNTSLPMETYYDLETIEDFQVTKQNP